MKKRTSTFLFLLAVSTGATLLLGAVTGPVITKASPKSDVTVGDVDGSAPAEVAAEPPAKPSGVSKEPRSAKLSFGVDDVVKMHQSGVEADVIMNFIENSRVPYHLNAEEIVQLHDLGVPSPIVTALIRHGAQVQQQAAAAYAQNQQKATEAAQAASASATPYSAPVYSPPPPTVTYNYAYPQYVYTGYPAYYSYPGYCYSSPFYFSFSYPGYRHFYSAGCFGGYPRFGFGGHFGFGGRIGAGHIGFGGGYHNGRHH